MVHILSAPVWLALGGVLGVASGILIWRGSPLAVAALILVTIACLAAFNTLRTYHHADGRMVKSIDTADAPNDYPPWPTSFFMPIILFRLNLPSWLIGIGAFCVYWGTPFLVAAWDGTLVTFPKVTELNQVLAGHSHLQGLLVYAFDHQVMQTGTAYLADRSHLVFSAVLAAETAVAMTVLREIPVATTSLLNDDLLTENSSYYRTNYALFQTLGNHWCTRVFSLLLAGVTFSAFLDFHNDSHFSYWWGSSAYGRAGTVLAGAEFLMVLYGTQTMLLIAAAALMIAKMLAPGLKLRPFHSDGCHGLSPVGRLIFLMWIFSILLAAAVVVTMVLGYLEIQKTRLAWTLALIALLTVPLTAIVPFAASIRSLLRARNAQLASLEPALNHMYASALTAIEQGHNEEISDIVERLSKLQEVHRTVADLHVWPFNPRALTLLMLVYAIQVILTLREFVGR
jgi:hypothetical protein